jgi:hypothetical protein
MKDLSVFCVDIGSIARKRLGWAAARDEGEVAGRKDISALVDALSADLESGPVALGFECPLWLPVPDDPDDLGRARSGEGNRPWSAGAGPAALATGLVQVSWVLGELRRRAPAADAYLRWKEFEEAETGIFLWEALVSGSGKLAVDLPEISDPDVRDAWIAAVESEKRRVAGSLGGDPEPGNRANALSLLGAALLRTGWSDDASLLADRCLVLEVGSHEDPEP